MKGAAVKEEECDYHSLTSIRGLEWLQLRVILNTYEYPKRMYIFITFS